MNRLHSTRRVRWACAVTALLLLPLAGCGGETETYETVAEGVLAAGDAVPSPKEEPILEIGGKVAAANDRDRLLLDLTTLEQLGLIRYSVEDPWLKREVSYTGVLVSDLVQLVRPANSATTMHLVALDDYEVDIALADAERWPIMLATRLDGKRMAIDNGGPTRIVFPYGLVGGIDELEHKDLWIWNVKSISFR